jgi:hypothetical protein
LVRPFAECPFATRMSTDPRSRHHGRRDTTATAVTSADVTTADVSNARSKSAICPGDLPLGSRLTSPGQWP